MPSLSYNYAHCWTEMWKGIDHTSPYYRVIFKFDDWSQSDAVANQLRGYTQRSGSVIYNQGGYTIRTAPFVHPLSPNLSCVDVQIEGLGNAIRNTQGYPSYDGGFLAHCEFRPIEWMSGGVTEQANQIDPLTPILWATQELDFDTEEYIHETNQYTWYPTNIYGAGLPGDPIFGQPSGIPIRVSLGVTTMTITYHQLPYLPMSTVRALRNSVNAVTFLGAPPGTIWFKGARTNRMLNTDGSVVQTVSLIFKERDIDWRKFLRKDKIGWEFITDQNNARVLPANDLSPLVQL